MVTGGSGYVGSLLVPRLLALGYEVLSYDLEWFGRLKIEHPKLAQVRGDIRDLPLLGTNLAGIDSVIHLACVSNDTSCGLDEKLSTSINYDAFRPLVVTAKLMGVKRFIYCSSSSVYGVSDAPEIKEDHPLVPLTLYNKYKGLCEPLLFAEANDIFTCAIIRPATVCGYAPRMRFDLTVNILTNHAMRKGKMTVFGGDQTRPNIHIDDMCRVYETLLEAPHEKIQRQIFNVGTQNLSLVQIAELVSKVVGEETGQVVGYERVSHTDNRSYHVNSEKIKEVLGFVPEKSIEDAVRDLVKHFQAGEWEDSLTNPIYTNVVQLQKLGYEARTPV